MSTSTPSINLELLEVLHPLFLDHNQGSKVMVETLRGMGLHVICLSDQFAAMTPDDQWIRHCGTKGYLIVTSDKGIEHDPINRQALVDSKAKVIMLDDGNTRAMLWAASILVSRRAIYSQLPQAAGPAILPLQNRTSKLLGKLRVPTVSLIEEVKGKPA